jgi:hypothetical protein
VVKSYQKRYSWDKMILFRGKEECHFNNPTL